MSFTRINRTFSTLAISQLLIAFTYIMNCLCRGIGMSGEIQRKLTL